jgi:hypothetical protein
MLNTWKAVLIVLALVVAVNGFLFYRYRLSEMTQEDAATETSKVAEAVSSKIEEAAIREHVAHLTGESPIQLEAGNKTTISERASEEGRRAAAEYMKESFERAGIPARIIEFTSDEGRGYNVDATLQGGEGEKHLWVTAHLDSVAVRNAGANDNASGLVLILLTARALEGLDLRHTVHFVAYDLEERGKLGSQAYMSTVVSSIRERHGQEAIIGNLNLDMVGYEKDEFDALMATCGPTGRIEEALVRASQAIDPPIALSESCAWKRLRYGSDQKYFWDAGLPAVLLRESAKATDYPCYHDPCDTADKLNVAYLRSMAWLVATASALRAAPEDTD